MNNSKLKKRIELSVNTEMGGYSVITPKTVVSEFRNIGYRGFAVTDYNSVQSFYDIYDSVNEINRNLKNNENRFKVIYGVKLLIDEIDRKYLVTLLVRNQMGLKNLYKIISGSNKFVVTKEIINKYRDGILVGSSCLCGEIYNLVKKDDLADINEKIGFYDYIEILNSKNYFGSVNNKSYMKYSFDYLTCDIHTTVVSLIVKLAEEHNVLVCAVNNVSCLNKGDSICRDMLMNYNRIGEFDNLFFDKSVGLIYDMEEMISDFEYLDYDKIMEIVVDNPNKIFELCDEIKIYPDDIEQIKLPKIENSKELIIGIVEEKLRDLYGNQLPRLVVDRVNKELTFLFKNNFEVIYLIISQLVKYNKDNGHLVFSRGDIGSSFIAYLMGITDINPLCGHYMCAKCNNSLFVLGTDVMSIEDKYCPNCKLLMIKDGYNLNYELLFGVDGNEIPNIDLNFSPEFRKEMRKYLQEIIGNNKLYSAGVIGKCRINCAMEWCNKSCSKWKISLNEEQKEEIIKKLSSVRKFNGKHPGGEIIVPYYVDINELTPVSDLGDGNYTTHFDYHKFSKCLYKLDLLSHNYCYWLEMLERDTLIKIDWIDLNDEKVYESINKGVLGILDFEDDNFINIVNNIKIKNMEDLIKVIGLVHGELDYVDMLITCSDDIYNELIKCGMDKNISLEICNFVRSGKIKKDSSKWMRYVNEMINMGVDNYFIDRCSRVSFLLSRSHCISYAKYNYYLVWYKTYYIDIFYKTYFNMKENDVFYELVRGKTYIKDMINKLSGDRYKVKRLKMAYEALDNGYIVDEDRLYDQVVKFVKEKKLIDIILIQREFKLGYNHTVSIVDRLKRDKIDVSGLYLF